jgi:hypothetical protein
MYIIHPAWHGVAALQVPDDGLAKGPRFVIIGQLQLSDFPPAIAIMVSE